MLVPHILVPYKTRSVFGDLEPTQYVPHISARLNPADHTFAATSTAGASDVGNYAD